MTLAAQIAADIALLLNTSELSVSLVYQPSGGAARTIVGNTDAGSDFVDTQHGRDEVEFLDVFVKRDSTDGIDDPQLGDKIKIASGSKWYSFSGLRTEEHENDWTLRFIRAVADKHGGLPRDR